MSGTPAIREDDYPEYSWEAELYIPSVDTILQQWQTIKNNASDRIEALQVSFEFHVDELNGFVFQNSGMSVFEWSQDVYEDISARNFVKEVVSEVAEKVHVQGIFDAMERVETAADALKEFISAPLQFLTEELPNFDRNGNGTSIDSLNDKIDAIFEKRDALHDALADLFLGSGERKAGISRQAANKFLNAVDDYGMRVQLDYSDVGIVTGPDTFFIDHRMTDLTTTLSSKGAGKNLLLPDDDHSYLLIDGARSSQLFGGKYTDVIAGGGGADELNGQEGDDYLNGGKGNDDILAEAGNDTIVGGEGVDALRSSETDSDIFLFSARDSGVGLNKRDVLYFANTSDTVQLSAIDANTRIGGQQTFVWDADGILGIGEARLVEKFDVSTYYVLQLNFDRDAKVDFELEFRNGTPTFDF